MAEFRRFFQLRTGQRWLLVKAAVLLGSVRLGLKILPFPSVRFLLARAARPTSRIMVRRRSVAELAWSIATVGGYIPGGTHCLSRALALQLLLARRGYECKVCFGVQKSPGAQITAHAWVEHGGQVLIGGGDLDRYVRLSAP